MAAFDRPSWSFRAEFFIYAFAFLFSPVSVWKFPIIWKENGGVAFLIPYVIFLLIMGIPLMFLEISLGQFMQKAGSRIWGVVPLFKGLSVTSMLVCVVRVSTNLTLTSWCAYYLYLTLTNQLRRCLTSAQPHLPLPSDNYTEPSSTPKMVIALEPLPRPFNESTRPTFYFGPSVASNMNNIDFLPHHGSNSSCLDQFSNYWSDDILEASDSIVTPGSAVIRIFIAVIVVTFVCFLIVMRDIEWSAKIMNCLAPLPLVGFLSIIAWMAASGWNLGEGVYSLVMPDFETLTKPETWLAASKANILTLGVGLNVFPSLASFNKYYTLRDSLLLCIMAVFTNLFASLSVFAMIGNVSAETLSKNDPSFLFTTKPEALETFRHSLILSSLFYIVIIIIVISTTAVYIESLVSSVVDLSHHLDRWRPLVVIGTLATCFLLTLPMSMQGGIYIFKLFDRATEEGFLIFIVCLLQCVGVAFIYGGSNLYDNLEAMTGKRPHWWLRFCWAGLSPLVLLATLVYQQYSCPLYHLELGVGHPYYELARMLLIVLMVTLLLPIPVVAVWVVCNKRGRCAKKLRYAMRAELQPLQVPIKWRLDGQWRKFSDYI